MNTLLKTSLVEIILLWLSFFYFLTDSNQFFTLAGCILALSPTLAGIFYIHEKLTYVREDSVGSEEEMMPLLRLSEPEPVITVSIDEHIDERPRQLSDYAECLNEAFIHMLIHLVNEGLCEFDTLQLHRLWREHIEQPFVAEYRRLYDKPDGTFDDSFRKCPNLVTYQWLISLLEGKDVLCVGEQKNILMQLVKQNQVERFYKIKPWMKPSVIDAGDPYAILRPTV